jgi:hypothetical protein
LVEADDDEVMYEIIFDLPDTGLAGNAVVPVTEPAPSDDIIHHLANKTVDILTDTVIQAPWQYPTQLHRSVIGNEPYDGYSP